MFQLVENIIYVYVAKSYLLLTRLTLSLLNIRYFYWLISYIFSSQKSICLRLKFLKLKALQMLKFICKYKYDQFTFNGELSIANPFYVNCYKVILINGDIKNPQ